MEDKNLEIKNSPLNKPKNETNNNKVKRQRTRKHNKKRVVEDNYKPPYTDVILSINIDTLMISDAVKASLKKANLNTVRDVVSKRMSEMYRVQNIGKKQCFEILKALNPYNVNFREEKKDNANDNKENLSKKPNNSKKNTKQNAVNNNIANSKIDTDTKNKQNKKKNKKSKKDTFQLKTLHDGMFKQPFIEIPQTPPKYLKFSKGDLFGLKTLDKKDLIPPIYNDIYYFVEDLAWFELDGKYGYINEKNEVVIDNVYDMVSSFSEGMAVVAKINDDKYECGYIDKKGNIVIPLQYDIATSFEDDKAFVLKDGRWGYINKAGEEVWL